MVECVILKSKELDKLMDFGILNSHHYVGFFDSCTIYICTQGNFKKTV